MVKFIFAITIAIIGANVLANAITIEPTSGSNLDRAITIDNAAR